jgi:SAM-dependent methyltransferase
MVNPRTPIDTFEAVVDGAVTAVAVPLPRPDVQRRYGWISHAGRSGFSFELPSVPGPRRVVIRGLRDSQLTAELHVDVSTGFPEDPAPPAALVRRATASEGIGIFRAEGAHWCTEFSDLIRRHAGTDRVERLLDWGCGCGRLTMPLLRGRLADEVHGCDIDAEAVAWCRENLRDAVFTHVNPVPPTPYQAGFFDVVVASSVFTHLSKRMQTAWLEELERIVRPGGLVVASVHGRFAATFLVGELTQRLGIGVLRPLLVSTLLASGFIALPDHSGLLRGVAPPGYYKVACQTPEFTRRTWSRRFEVLEYREGGLGFQDLVAIRSRS